MKKMTDAIAHRGPDSEGVFIDGCVGLGHRRLAILDLSAAGQQPMVSADYRFILSYNGEVYNYQELRSQLEERGYWFRSQTDTEVVLYALVEWGVTAFDFFNGMFALALWDRKEKTLLLGRDRYGIKPLYYTTLGTTFLFGSEQKAILAHPTAKPELDKEALLEYFTFQNIFTNRTLIKGIKLLPAGHYGRLHLAESPELKLSRYWDYRFREPDGHVDLREYREELDRLLQQAVNRQLVADVEMGAYLSGGMDSGTLTALAARQLPYIKTFTCGFDLSSASGIELAFDERVKAEAMSARFKTEHYEMVLKAGDMERCLPKLARHLEEPRVGQSYPNYYVAQLASKFVKVVLSGSGGDELFGGYPWRYYRAAKNQDFEHYIDQYYLYWHRLVSNSDLRRIFAPVWSEVKDVWTRDIFRDVFATHDNALDCPEDYINHSLYFEAKTFLHGLFVVEDKLSMAHGLESRVPFMDNDLVEFAMGCPVEFKLNNLVEVIRINENEPGNKPQKYFQKTNDGKQILRDVMERYIPTEITQAVKQGFSSPDASWFKGESIEFVKRCLLDSNAHIYQILDRQAVSLLIEEHLEGKQNRRLLIWSLLNIEQWLQEFLGGVL
ncbi:asparagine synthase (glutamine-hydrolyzing) [Candidatus Synechococcus calcipolaris G9]|uniref:asparagine synthase (glutamine-hydrolyzing) n=1 Tax=Candidatus Synechococcus calcipolaris G9 TaxID=1497997 RepID=A0ABT6EXK7_9SYNE|nr:asparagine synthase (glutamine-hydrolyzing) [Candidatus Synechococcus calcipolaris G9]